METSNAQVTQNIVPIAPAHFIHTKNQCERLG